MLAHALCRRERQIRGSRTVAPHDPMQAGVHSQETSNREHRDFLETIQNDTECTRDVSSLCSSWELARPGVGGVQVTLLACSTRSPQALDAARCSLPECLPAAQIRGVM